MQLPIRSLLVAASFAAVPWPTAASLGWEPPLDIASGRGERGPWRQNESRYDYVDDPAVAMDDGGGIGVAWVDQARKDVFFRRFPRGDREWPPPVNVSRSPATFSWLPRIAFAPEASRHVFVLWQEIIFSGGSHGGDILFARSQDGGASFMAPINLSRSVGGDGKGRINRDVWHNGSLDLAVGAGGAVHAAWTEYDGALWSSRSTDGGSTFSPPRRVASEARPARAPSLALGGDGRVFLAWTVGEDDAADIRLAISGDGGLTFGAPGIVARTRGYSDAPKLAVDRAGTLHLVYGESDGPFGASRVHYTRSVDSGRTFEKPRDLSGRGLAPAQGAAFPSIALGARGDVVVTWELARGRHERPRGLGATLSRDGGGSFARPAHVAHGADPAGGANGSLQGMLMKKLAANAAGELAVVNSAFAEGRGSRVWLVRGRID